MATREDVKLAIRNELTARDLDPGTFADSRVDDLDAVCEGLATVITAGGSGLADGDYGDVTVGGGGTTMTIDNSAVTLAKMADVATARIVGRTTAGTGAPEALTGTQTTALLDAVTSGAKGLAPASGGGTANYLRADATWTTPPNHDPHRGYMTAVVNNGHGNTVITINMTYAVCLGKAPYDMSSVTVGWKCNTLGTGAITWAEVGIATGTFTWGANPSLSRIGWADISGDLAGTGLKTTTVTCTISAGDTLWWLFGVQRPAGNPQIVTYATDAMTSGGSASLAATRISTMAVPTAFTAIAGHAPYGIIIL
jgi:hypothetical protein